jgi:uncharacterized membrane protein (Fun14 family)
VAAFGTEIAVGVVTGFATFVATGVVILVTGVVILVASGTGRQAERMSIPKAQTKRGNLLLLRKSVMQERLI